MPEPPLCRFIARRMVDADLDGGLAALLCPGSSAAESYPSFHREVLDGVLEAVRGLKRARMPGAMAGGLSGDWPNGATPRSAPGSPRWGSLFGDARAESGSAVGRRGSTATPDARQFALRNLVDRRDRRARAGSAFRLLDDPRLRGPAIRALAAYNDPATPRVAPEPLRGALAGGARRRDRHDGLAPGLGGRAAGRASGPGPSPAAT